MLAYSVCEDLSKLIDIWLVFAGDNETWREVIKHRKNCEICLENNNQWITKHILEAQPGESEPKPENELTGINAVYAKVRNGWRSTIAPMPELAES